MYIASNKKRDSPSEVVSWELAEEPEESELSQTRNQPRMNGTVTSSSQSENGDLSEPYRNGPLRRGPEPRRITLRM